MLYVEHQGFVMISCNKVSKVGAYTRHNDASHSLALAAWVLFGFG